MEDERRDKREFERKAKVARWRSEPISQDVKLKFINKIEHNLVYTGRMKTRASFQKIIKAAEDAGYFTP